MKISKYINGLLLIALSIVVTTSCEKDELFPEAAISPKTVAELVEENPQLSTLFTALQRVKLDSVLSTSSTFTVFAPNNDAFSGIDLATMTDEQLTAVLTNHVRATTTADFAGSMTTGYTSTLATGPDDLNLNMHTNVVEAAITLNGAGDIVNSMKDLGGTNGVVHVVDAVLLPPTVADHIAANPEYSSLAAALAKADLNAALAVDGPFTVFAPNNTAFEQFMADVNGAFGWTSIDDIPAQVLRDVLLYHVVSGENMVAADADGTEPTTLQGENLMISGTSINDASYTDAGIILTDIQGVNGIVHGVNKVLLPEDVFQMVLSATLNMSERATDRGFTAFNAAAAKVSLSVDLDADELTAFVPNNGAFDALFATVNNFGSLDDFDTPEELETLKQLLEYHLYAGKLMTSGFTNGGDITTVNGDTFSADLNGDDARLIPSIPDAIPSTIVASNIGSTNGIIHEINRVLVPESLAGALGIEIGTPVGLHPVGDIELVFFDWNGKDPWWGNVGVENEASLSLDGGSYGRANFQTGGTGWQDLFWRNGGTLNGQNTVGTNLSDYSLKFDINVLEPIADGMFRIRFNNSNGVDAFYNWAPWNDTGEAFDTDGWITVEIPLTVLGQPDFSLVDAEFGMAFEGADVLLNFAIDNVRFDTPGNGGPDPVDDENLVFFDWNGKDPWWGNVAVENDAALSLDGGSYGRANFQTGGTGWQDLFWRNDAGTFSGASTVGSDVANYALKFDINILEPIGDGMFRIRFNDSNGVDAFYNWAPWNDTGEPLETNGWTTITIPCSLLGVPDFSTVNAEFGMAFEGADILLNFAIDNVRFEAF